MPEFTAERIEQIKQYMRRAIIRDPSVSGLKLSKALNIDPHVSSRYLKEVRADEAQKIKDEIEKMKEKDVVEELSEVKTKFEEMLRELWKIVSNRTSSQVQKIRAIEALKSIMSKFFSMQMDAGLFKRHLGEQVINLTEIFKAIEQASKLGKKKKDEVDEGEH